MVKNKSETKCSSFNGSCTVYGLGFLGSAIYYISSANTFWLGVVGVLKSIVWPAFVVFELMKFFGM